MWIRYKYGTFLIRLHLFTGLFKLCTTVRLADGSNSTLLVLQVHGTLHWGNVPEVEEESWRGIASQSIVQQASSLTRTSIFLLPIQSKEGTNDCVIPQQANPEHVSRGNTVTLSKTHLPPEIEGTYSFWQFHLVRNFETLHVPSEVFRKRTFISFHVHRSNWEISAFTSSNFSSYLPFPPHLSSLSLTHSHPIPLSHSSPSSLTPQPHPSPLTLLGELSCLGCCWQTPVLAAPPFYCHGNQTDLLISSTLVELGT